MRYLLDTNIVSNVIKPQPSPALLQWMAEQADEDLCISALTLAELRRGILELPDGKRRRTLEAWYTSPEGPPALFAGRILPFDEKAALAWATLMADSKKRGRPRSAMDTIIAAIAVTRGCVVVTGNERDFEGVKVMNPTEWT